MHTFKPKLWTASARLSPRIVQAILFASILGIGVFARLWEYRKLPPGLNVDEASIGVDAYDVYRFGMDRNGVSYPTQFIAFGQEQNALYGYILVPLVAVLGLRASVVRLPMLAFGLVTLPVIYFAIKRHFGAKLGLLSMFVVAISPWHIMLSRWGLDVNTFPFILTLGFACMLEAARDNRWFILACGFLALCFYTYGPSYLIVPVFLITATALLARLKLLSWKPALTGFAVFGLLTVPVALFLAVNTFRWSSIHIGPMTIPRLPTTVPRFLSATQGLESDLPATLGENLARLGRVLVLQTDYKGYNVLDPFGYFYGVTFPLAVLGIVVLALRAKAERHVGSAFVLFWLAGCILLGILQPVNINRLNAVFIPLLISIGVAIDWLAARSRWVMPASIMILLAAFIGFNVAYHGDHYAQDLKAKFRPGLLPAIHFASTATAAPICVTDEPGQPYIFVLFSERLAPASYLQDITYLPSPDAERRVGSLGRYTFGRRNCADQPLHAYVLHTGELPPPLGNKYNYEFFDDYVVYYPRR